MPGRRRPRPAPPGLALPHLPRLDGDRHPGRRPEDALSLLRGDWHSGYDPYVHRVAPQCTPLATNTLHAVGFAHAARLKGEDTAALVFVGDGATSEGDTHEALNFAGGLAGARGVPGAEQRVRDQRAARQADGGPVLAYKGVGYGVRSLIVDGNDAAAVYAAVRAALATRPPGGGPTLIEAITYRIEAHTNADDASRYRASDEVQEWLAKDPIDRLETYLRERGLLDDDGLAAVRAEAEDFAAQLRDPPRRRSGARPGGALRARVRVPDRRPRRAEGVPAPRDRRPPGGGE